MWILWFFMAQTVPTVGESGVEAPIITLKVQPDMEGLKYCTYLVLIEAVFRVDGTVDAIKVLRGGQCPDQVERAKAALKHWVFQPGRKNGQACDVRMYLAVHFEVR